MTSDGVLLTLVGAPGSGKSTWARQNFSARQIVSSDELRGRIGVDPNDQRASAYAFQALHAIVAGRMELGQATVVDATHRTPQQREEVANHAVRWGRSKFLVVFTAPLEVCLARNARRRGTRRVPEAWLIETHSMIAAAFQPTQSCRWGGYDGILFVPHEGPGCITGTLDLKRWVTSPWLDIAREEPPSWWSGNDRYPSLRRVGTGSSPGGEPRA